MALFNQGAIKPPTLDGETSWNIYKRRFEAAADSNGWNKEEKALMLALRGKASEIFHVIPVEKQRDYEAVLSALEVRSGVSLEQLDKLSVIHVTGTNGKGSTCAYCESILRNHGYKTGFFSSPHLLDVRERIRIDGKPISKSMFANYFWKIYPLLDSQKIDSSDMPLYFRFLTVVAFHVFLEHKVDVAIIEVGIGGEYDCTNIIRNTAVVGITPLDMDHTKLLGNSLESIAWNKSGIMKEGCLAFSTKQPPNVLQIFRERSLERKCTFNVVEENSYLDNNSNMPPHVRKTNASLALALTEAFISRDKTRKFSLGLAKQSIEETRWPGRYEIKHFKGFRFYLDGAHTLDSICVCRDWFSSHANMRNVKRCLVFNITGERDPEAFFKELSKCEFNTVIFMPNVGGDNDRSDTADFKLPEDKQLERCEGYRTKWLELEVSFTRKADTVRVMRSFSKAVEFLENNNEDCDILVTGSIHLIGAALSVLDPTLNGALTE